VVAWLRLSVRSNVATAVDVTALFTDEAVCEVTAESRTLHLASQVRDCVRNPSPEAKPAPRSLLAAR